MQDNTFYLDELTLDTFSYELKTFRSQHDEVQLEKYLKNYSKKHVEKKVNKIYLIRSTKTHQIAAWFGLKTATLPFVQDVSQKVACKALFVFAIDTPKLIKYYKETLQFREITNTNEKQFFEYAVPDYDEDCKFLYFPLNE